jgi:hypothetical protein
MQLLANHRPAYLTVSLIRRPQRLERLLASRPLAQPSAIHYGVKQSPGSKLEMAKIHARRYSSGLMRRPGQAEATRFIHHFRSIAATGIRRGWQGINTAPTSSCRASLLAKVSSHVDLHPVLDPHLEAGACYDSSGGVAETRATLERGGLVWRSQHGGDVCSLVLEAEGKSGERMTV